MIGLVAPARLVASTSTREEANKAYDGDRYEDIVRLFTVLLEQSPSKEDTVDFLDKRAYGLRKLERNAEAVRDLRRLLELGAESPPLLNRLSVALYQTGEWEESFAVGMRSYLQGREQGLSEERLALFQDNFTSTSWEIAAKFPAFVEATDHAKRGNHDRVLELVSTVLSEHPTGAHELACRTERAKASLALDRAALAVRDWQRVRDLGGDPPAMLEQLGECYWSLRNNRQAYETFRLILARGSKPEDSARHRANFDRAILLLNIEVGRLQSEAQTALERGDLPAAFAAYELAMSFPGTRDESFGRELYDFSQIVAVSYFKQLEEPKNRLRQKALEGDAVGLQEEWKKLRVLAPGAEDYLDKLRDQAYETMMWTPGQRAANSLLFKVREMELSPKNAKKAIKLLNEATAKAPSAPLVYLQRARWFTLLKDKQALADLDAAVRILGSDSLDTMIQRGLYFEAVGDRKSALEQLRRAALMQTGFLGGLPNGIKEALRADLRASPLVRPAVSRVLGPHGLPLDPAEAARFDAAELNSKDDPHNKLESYDAKSRHRFACYSWMITLYPLSAGPYQQRAYWLRGNYAEEKALQDLAFANPLSEDRSTAALVSHLLPKTAYAPKVRPIEQGSGSPSTNAPDNRYCMRCRATGTVYAYEDDVDAHNNRVRVERKITCPECGGRGVK